MPNKIIFWIKRQYVKLKQLPKPIRILIATLFLIFGAINIPNPMINGVLFILVGLRLLYGELKKHSKARKEN
jgi:hypothetical protein